jgi:hypothetical protein
VAGTYCKGGAMAKKGAVHRRGRSRRGRGGNKEGSLKVGVAFLGAQLARNPKPYFGRGKINSTQVNFRLGKNRSYAAQHPHPGFSPISRRGSGPVMVGAKDAADSSRFLGNKPLNA